MARKAGESWRCGKCDEPVVGAATIRGTVVPIEVESVSEGNIILFRAKPRTRNAGEMQARHIRDPVMREMLIEMDVPLHRYHSEAQDEVEDAAV